MDIRMPLFIYDSIVYVENETTGRLKCTLNVSEKWENPVYVSIRMKHLHFPAIALDVCIRRRSEGKINAVGFQSLCQVKTVSLDYPVC